MTAAVFSGRQQLDYGRPIKFFSGVSPGAHIARILTSTFGMVDRRGLSAIVSLPRPSCFDRPDRRLAWTQTCAVARGRFCRVRAGYTPAITDLRFACLVSAEQRTSGFLAGDWRPPS